MNAHAKKADIARRASFARTVANLPMDALIKGGQAQSKAAYHRSQARKHERDAIIHLDPARARWLGYIK